MQNHLWRHLAIWEKEAEAKFSPSRIILLKETGECKNIQEIRVRRMPMLWGSYLGVNAWEGYSYIEM